MVVLCPVCSIAVTDVGIRCDSCWQWYHYRCGAVTARQVKDTYQYEDWHCVDCAADQLASQADSCTLHDKTASTASRAKYKRLALVVGNSAYMHRKKLPEAVACAEAIGTVLRDDMPDGTQFELVGGVHADVTFDEFDAAVDALVDRTDKNTIVLVYYAGHGKLPVKNNSYAQLDNILLPVDYSKTREVRHIRTQTLLSRLHAKRPLRTMLFLDCCRQVERDSEKASGRRKPFKLQPGQLISYSTDAGDSAVDDSQGSSAWVQCSADGSLTPYTAILAAHLPQQTRMCTLLKRLQGASDMSSKKGGMVFQIPIHKSYASTELNFILASSREIR